MPSTPFALDIDLPSGELVVGHGWEPLAPLPPGTRRYSLNHPDTRAKDTEVLARAHLFCLHGSSDFALELRQHVQRGDLVVQAAHASLPKDHVTLATLDDRTLHFMDGADYDAQMKALGPSGTLLARVSIPAGRWRFAVNHERLFSFPDEIPRSFRWCQVHRVGPAQPIVRAAPPTFPDQPQTLMDTAMGQFLAACLPRLLGMFPHPAQAVVDLLTTYGGFLSWKNGLLTDQAVAQPDLPAWSQGVAPGELPPEVRLPMFPALAALGPASVDQVTAHGDTRSVALSAPLNADRHWLALALIVFASLRAAPEVAAAPNPQDDAQVVAEIDVGFRQLCGLVTHAQRWEEVKQALPVVAPLVSLFEIPAVRFSARQQALAQMRQESAAQASPTPDLPRRRRP
jgi:hypothetical protein